jgi:Protein of unknown function (DUF4238)
LNQKKKHHYVAQTYLRGFCNPEGKGCVYSKDRPTKSWWAAPETIAFEKYYYSQPLPDGGQDNNRLEDFFSSIEDRWPTLVSKIQHRERHEGGLDQLLLFAMMHRVRVPTARDAAEKMLAESVRMIARHLNDRGELLRVYGDAMGIAVLHPSYWLSDITVRQVLLERMLSYSQQAKTCGIRGRRPTRANGCVWFQ